MEADKLMDNENIGDENKNENSKLNTLFFACLKIPKAVNIAVSIISGIFLIVFSCLFINNLGIMAVMFAVCLCGIIYILCKNKLAVPEIPRFWFIFIFVIDAVMTYLLMDFVSVFFVETQEVYRYLSAGCLYIGIIPFCSLAGHLTYKSFLVTVKDKSALYISLFIGYLLYFFIPVETFVNNYNDYSFSIFVLLLAMLPLFIGTTFVLGVLINLFPKKVRKVICVLLMGIGIATYVQYMFLNSNINRLNGGTYDWKNFYGQAIVHLIIYIIVVLAVVILGLLKDKLAGYLASAAMFFTVVLFVSNIALVVGAPSKTIFYIPAFDYTYEDQFKVANGKNVILFVLDAVDNHYLLDIYDNEPELFDAYSDFTMFKNTCSVYDETTVSLEQMMTASEYGQINTGCDLFYEELKNNNYTINFFNYQVLKDSYPVNRFVDNYVEFDATGESIIFYKSIRQNIMKLTEYQIFPDVLKNIIDINSITFMTQVGALNTGAEVCYKDAEFMENLNLSVSDKYENLFMLQHINGSHPPFEFNDSHDTTVYCLKMVEEYLNQMKQLGVYEDSVIIITSDHGLHDDIKAYADYPTASTPIFMVKKAGESGQDKMAVTNIPEYHTDILATFIELMKLPAIPELGKSVYEYSEDDVRERKWVNRGHVDRSDSPYKVGCQYVYTYCGDMTALEYAVDNEMYVEE